jgi:hypothetical protein
MKQEPVLLLVLGANLKVACLTEAGGALTLLAADHTTAGLLVAAGTFLTGVGGVLARSLVTPTSRRRHDMETVLETLSRSSWGVLPLHTIIGLAVLAVAAVLAWFLLRASWRPQAWRGENRASSRSCSPSSWSS